MKHSRKSETYNIKVVPIEHRDLTQSPDSFPEVTGITSHETLLDMMHSFEHMATELNGKLYISRTLRFWCDRCGAYIGSRDVEYIAQRYHSGLEGADPLMVAGETEVHTCSRCGETTEFYFQPVLHLLY